MYRNFTVSAEFPTRYGQTLVVRDGDGRIIERIVDRGTSVPFKAANGEMKKAWSTVTYPVGVFLH